MNSRLALAVLLLSTAAAQWTSLDLSSVRGSRQVEPLLIGTSLYLGHHPVHIHPTANRLRWGLSLTGGSDLSGSGLARRSLRAFPALHGAYLVTANLSLHGKLAGWTGRDLVQVSAYGLDLNLGADSNWFVSVTLGTLGGPDDLRCRSNDVLLRRATQRWGFPLQYGLGTNLYVARILIEDAPHRLEGQTNYLFLALSRPLRGGRIGFQVKIHPKFVALSMDLSATFH